jgi:dTDP-4-dehydrorhamnose reductase
MKILVTGKDGMVGWELARALPRIGEVTALARKDLDITDPAAIVERVRALKPDVIVNAAAYTAVDKAESDRENAFLVNAAGPAFLAEEARALGALLVHYSTDYVFDGTKLGPYVETDPTNPLSVYGESKLAGEKAIQASGCRHLIFRTSWIYASRGRNFLLTMLKLGKERSEVRVVDDQHGAPTWARDIGQATTSVLRHRDPPNGIYHMTAAGETTWCGFAEAIFRTVGIGTTVVPITTAEYPTPARRPANSVLDAAKLVKAFGTMRLGWEASLKACLADRMTVS